MEPFGHGVLHGATQTRLLGEPVPRGAGLGCFHRSRAWELSLGLDLDVDGEAA